MQKGLFPQTKQFCASHKTKSFVETMALATSQRGQPPFPSMNSIWVAFDGFFVDTEKLYLHPYIGSARDSDSLFKIYHIFTQLLIFEKNPERAAEFLDRHLRGNLMIKVGDRIYVYRDRTGFKPLVSATNRDKTLNIIASENSLRTSLINMEFADVKPGQLLKIDKNGGLEVLTSESTISLMTDPFEFIRESNVVATVNGKSIYQIPQKYRQGAGQLFV